MKAIAFSGGKESAILLYKFWEEGTLVFTVPEKKPFPEVTEYSEPLVQRYQIESYPDFITAFKKLQEKGIEIVISGQRQTDPNGPTSAYAKTDWSENIVCYFPLWDWTHRDVWSYIDFYNIPICSLYSQGYTSLGESDKTFPNADLFQNGDFLPAWELPLESDERAGRISKSLPVGFTGEVIRGKGLGKQLGFPTANLSQSPNLTPGVYWGSCNLFTKTYLMVMSIGTNPMFGDLTTEVHLINGPGIDFYGEVLSVTVQGFIRTMQKYSTLELLIENINKDVQIATKFKHNVFK